MTYDIATLSPNKRHWIVNSNIPRRFWGWEPSDIVEDRGEFPASVESWMKQVAQGKIIRSIGLLGTTGVGLLLDGSPGMGKTTHAVTVLMEVIRNLPEDDAQQQKLFNIKPDSFGRNFRPIYYLTFPEFLQRKKALFDASYEDRKELQMQMDGFHGRASEDRFNVRLLVIDDLGKELGSDYEKASFDELIRSRYDAAFPSIITTNSMKEIWGDKYSDAMGSFAHESFRRVTLIGDDLRAPKAVHR
jgi:DNA replication protein DnaC